MQIFVNGIACGVLAGLRLYGVTTVRFQAIAHVYVGGLFVYGWQVWSETPIYMALAVALTVVEVFQAVKDRGLLPFSHPAFKPLKG